MDNKAIAAGKGRGSSSSSSSQKSSRSSSSCSICSFKSYIASRSNNPSSQTISSGGKKTTPLGMGMLDASFVNIHSPSDANSNKNDIDSILNEALSHNNPNYTSRGGGGDASNKCTLQSASMKMDAYAEAAMEMIHERSTILIMTVLRR